MKKAFSLIIILILLFSLSVPLSAEKLPDGRTIPKEVEDYTLLVMYDCVGVSIPHRVGTVTPNDLSPLMLFTLMYTKTLCEEKNWIAEYSSCEKIQYSFAEHGSWIKDEVDAYIIPQKLMKDKFAATYGKEVAFPEGDLILQTDRTIYFIEDVRNGEPVYIYHETDTNAGGDCGNIHIYQVYDFEYTENELNIYVNFAVGCYVDFEPDPASDLEFGKAYLYAEQDTKHLICAVSIEEFDSRDRFDQKYYAQYLHTFKSNGKGGYYWYSTELIGVGGKPVDEVIPSTDDTAIVYPILAVCSVLVMVGTLTTKKRTKT